MACDVRNERTEKAIVEAMLQLLETIPFSQVSVSALARRAGVSRSTFYAHFGSPYDVFVRVVGELLGSSRLLGAQLKCPSCQEGEQSEPFCMQLRNQPRYRSLVRQPEFLPCVLEQFALRSKDSAYASLKDAGLPPEIVESVFWFQMTGCFVAATKTDATADWASVQMALDAFVKGGLSTLRLQAQSGLV